MQKGDYNHTKREVGLCLFGCVSLCAVLEDRLSRQQVENESERERLQSLTAKLEAHISQQSRQMEQVCGCL